MKNLEEFNKEWPPTHDRIRQNFERMRQLIELWGKERGDCGGDVEELRLLMVSADCCVSELRKALDAISRIAMSPDLPGRSGTAG